jgi:hypothetical protein
MPRPDLDTLACVNADCQHDGRPAQGNLTIRKVYGQDGRRSSCAPYLYWAMKRLIPDNFCRAHGNLRIKDERGFHHRTPAMASGLTDRIWSTRAWLLSPILGGKDHHRTQPTYE